jgi:hypothetical protein
VFESVEHLSVPKQIEYWSKIGKIAQENPDLPFSLIREILIADQEPVIGKEKVGNLLGGYDYQFRLSQQQVLLA